MSELAMYHVTDASNVDQIMEEGLQPDHNGEIFLTETIEDAEFLGEAYHTIEEPVVLEATVMESSIREGPGDAGDVDEYVKSGPIMPVDLGVVDG